MSDLQQAIEARLRAVAEGVPVNASWSVYPRLADECIRQMEWARRRCYARMGDFGHNDHSLVMPPLSAAAEGWSVRERLEIPCSRCGTYSIEERKVDGRPWFFCPECGRQLFAALTPEQVKDANAHPLDYIDEFHPPRVSAIESLDGGLP